ncbi:MAG TPA: S8 family serine peptidase [Verrucomicrobiae bacterium]|nr:S8 family serine peptidase [Verrucomicrobiae bacterium]
MNNWLTVEQARKYLREGTGRGIRIAVLDSGIEASHPELKGLRIADDLAIVDDGLQLNCVPGRGVDMFGHGTAIASILRQLAPEAQLGSFRVLGEQLRSRTAIIREGVRQALDRGYHILHCSFGCGREDQVLQYKDWIDEAYLRGRHIVAACNNYDYLKREWPGHFPSVITVNFARTADPERFYYRAGQLVEFAARGDDLDVPWCGGRRKKVTGSSFAVPHVAGLVARLLSSCPQLPPLEAKALLHQIAEPWPDNS